MQEQLEKLSDAWYVFAILGLAFAIAAYWIYRKLEVKEGIRQNFA